MYWSGARRLVHCPGASQFVDFVGGAQATVHQLTDLADDWIYWCIRTFPFPLQVSVRKGRSVACDTSVASASDSHWDMRKRKLLAWEE